EIATRLKHAVREQVGLPITIGIARTKFLAKVASGVAKPDGLLVVPPDRERGVATVRDVAGLPETILVSLLGRASGRHLHALAHGLDARPVQAGRRRGSIGSQRARGRGRWSVEDVDADLVALVDRVTRRMRAARRVGRTVVLRLRFADYTRATRSHTLG